MSLGSSGVPGVPPLPGPGVQPAAPLRTGPRHPDRPVPPGVFEKPRLSAIPGPVVRSGEDVTLQCQTRSGFDQFALSKEGQAQPRKEHDRWYQASFSLVTVTAAHSGVYRCYSFSSSSPYLWSAPSDPLQLVVTGKGVRPAPSAPMRVRGSPGSSGGHRLCPSEGAGLPGLGPLPPKTPAPAPAASPSPGGARRGCWRAVLAERAASDCVFMRFLPSSYRGAVMCHLLKYVAFLCGVKKLEILL